MLNPITIVSCFYLLENSKHENINYVFWLINFFKIETPKIIYTDKKTFDKLFFKIKPITHLKFIICEIEDFKTHKLLVNQDWNKQHDKDPEKKIHNINLYKIWNEKTEFLNKSIKNNYFNSEYFFWCDAGIFRDENLQQKYRNWPNLSKLKQHKDKLLLLEINKFSKSETQSKLPIDFTRVNRIGGGIFGGNIKTLNIWIKDYYKIFKLFLDHNLFVGKDQNIMANVYIEQLIYKNYIELIKPNDYFIKNKGNIWFYLLDYLL